MKEMDYDYGIGYNHKKKPTKSLNDYSPNHYILFWDLKMYKEQCQQCEKWCEAEIFESQFEGCIISFWVILYEIINHIPIEIHEGNRNKLR